MTASASWEVFTSKAVLVVNEPSQLTAAKRAVQTIVDGVDLACSRFRDDSELARVNTAAGARVAVSPLFVDICERALTAAQLSGGDLDPTIGSSLRACGYDRDFASIRAGGSVRFVRAAGFRCVRLRKDESSVQIPAGVELDFGASAKAYACDLAAAAARDLAPAGLLISIGGDIATAGPAPDGGWNVLVTDDHSADVDARGQTVAIFSGGLATSSTTRRRWRRGHSEIHHILNPATGAPARSPWRTVSVVAASCLEANIASTTAIIRENAALAWLQSTGLPARAVAEDGVVTFLGGWPAEDMVDA